MALDHPIILMVGLGNPGPTYSATRHNAGAWFIERLARKYDQSLSENSKVNGRTAKITVHGHICHLLIPNTYMNLSGSAVAKMANYYQLDPQQMLIAHDELDLAPGIVKFKYDGGHGGHNGLRDIFDKCNTQAFYRLRIGIGKPPHKNAVADYVLKAPSIDDQIIIDNAIDRALLEVPTLLKGEIEKAMHSLHSMEKK